MGRQISKCGGYRAIAVTLSLAVFGLVAIAGNACQAGDGNDAPPPLQLRPEIRSGGVIEESYNYHRQSSARRAVAPASIEPAGGWYGYGFPVSTFRWGWFGASHYYPTVWWHDGYYGDCCRYGYRRGY